MNPFDRSGSPRMPGSFDRVSRVVASYLDRHAMADQIGVDRSQPLPRPEGVKVRESRRTTTAADLLARQNGQGHDALQAAARAYKGTRGLAIYTPHDGGQSVPLWDGCHECYKIKLDIDQNQPPDVWVDRATRECPACGALWSIGIVAT